MVEVAGNGWSKTEGVRKTEISKTLFQKGIFDYASKFNCIDSVEAEYSRTDDVAMWYLRKKHTGGSCWRILEEKLNVMWKVGAEGITDDEIRQLFNMIDKDKSGKLSLRVLYFWVENSSKNIYF